MSNNKVFNQFIEALGTNMDYLYAPKGDIGSAIIKELIAEDIPYININGYLLINKENANTVGKINNEILSKRMNFYKETDVKDMEDALAGSNRKEFPVCSLDNIPAMDYVRLKDAADGIEQLTMITGEQKNMAYKVSVPTTKMFDKKGKNFAQAYVESLLCKEPSSQKEITSFENRLKVEQIIENCKTINGKYHITSEIDPSLFMTITNDGFTLNRWQAGKDGIKKIKEKTIRATQDNYETEFYQTINMFPDIKIIEDNSKLSDFIYSRKSISIKIDDIKRNRGAKVLAKRLNMIVTRDYEYDSLQSYMKEIANILTEAQKANPDIQNYKAGDIEKIKAIINRYGLEEGLQQVIDKHLPEFYEEKISPQEKEQERSISNADTNRKGTEREE